MYKQPMKPRKIPTLNDHMCGVDCALKKHMAGVDGALADHHAHVHAPGKFERPTARKPRFKGGY